MDLGNFNLGDMEKGIYGNVEEDEELLAELAALQEEEFGAQRSQSKPSASMAHTNARPAQKGATVAGVDPHALAAALADPKDEEDDKLETDEDLLSELAGLVGERNPPTSGTATTTTTRSDPPAPSQSRPSGASDEAQIAQLRQLHAVYKKLHETSERSGDGAKARRHKRAVDKLVELIADAERGKQINPSEIPVSPPNFKPETAPTAPVAQPAHHPAVIREAARVAPPVPQRELSRESAPPAPTAPPPRLVPPAIPARTASSSSVAAPVSSNSADPKESIRTLLRHRRDLYVSNGKAAIAAHDKVAAKEFVETAKAFDQAIAALETASAADMDVSDIPPSPPQYRKGVPAPSAATPLAAPAASSSASSAAAAPPTSQPQKSPGTFLEALQQRQKRYADMAEKAKNENNDRKHRMNLRQAGQYAEAIRDARAGRPVNVAELPSLPDMPNMPPQAAGGGAARAGPAPGIRPPPEVGPLAPSGVAGKSRNASQLDFLLQRQDEFKKAAIHAKARGDIEHAKKYLLEAKGFDKMIEAARAGLPVSIKQTPIPPQSTTTSATLQPRIQPSSTSVSGVEGRGERLALLERALIEQVRLAESNQMRFTRLGDVGKVRLFESWAKASKQDLLLVRAVSQQGLSIPKFHYEMRQIPSADMFPDLAEDVVELTVVNCKDVPLPTGYEPQHANLFVKYTFPYPTDAQPTGKTKLIARECSPVFNETVMLQVGSGKTRNSKLLRAFKRGPIKLEVFQKGGFMRSDKLLGTCEWKVDRLETCAEMEESLPLKEGRKAVGGLLTVRLRIREPIGDAKAQTLPQKWLLLDD